MRITPFTPARLAWALAAGAAASAHALPLTLSDPYQWLEIRSTNTLGRTPGLLQNVGINSVVPNGLAGTTGIATQGSTTLTLPFTGTTAISNEFNRTFAPDLALFGAWTLTFTNGANTATTVTPAISPNLSPMPFATDVLVTNTSATSFSWKIPGSASVDAVRINVFDHGRLNLAGTSADIVYNATFARDTTSFTLPTTLANGLPLKTGNLYTLEINLLDYASNATVAPQGDLRNRSRLYVDFVPTLTPAAGTYLPVVEPGVNGGPPIFHFGISAVGPGLVYIDPLIATGYRYAIGAGDPNFASVLLPTGIGDNRYRIVLPDGTQANAEGGTSFAFAAGGVPSFTVLGIEASAGLDASDPTAFVTGLTFAGTGHFTGTMQAVPVPEAPTWLMLAAGMLALGLLSGRRAVA